MSRFRLHYKNKPYRLLGRVRHSETLETLTLYECLYPNEMGTMWVRPEAMFHESVELPQGRIPRFREVPLEITAFEALTDEAWAAIEPLAKPLFDDVDRKRVQERLARRADPLILIGTFEGDPVGFKIGHGAGDGAFASWLGCVRADRRGLGVGGTLMRAQHDWARERGYRRVVTKTMNRWPEMLMLNLRSGFVITGTEKSDRGLEIVLEKSLDLRPE